MAFLQMQVWGLQPACYSPDCEPEPIKNCCGAPVEAEPLGTGCASDGHSCPCCVTGNIPADNAGEPAKQAWEATLLQLAPVPADTLLPAEPVFRNAGLYCLDERNNLPNAPPRSVLSCWIL